MAPAPTLLQSASVPTDDRGLLALASASTASPAISLWQRRPRTLQLWPRWLLRLVAWFPLLPEPQLEAVALEQELVVELLLPPEVLVEANLAPSRGYMRRLVGTISGVQFTP